MRWALLLALASGTFASAADAPVRHQATFMYRLGDNDGPHETSFAVLSYDAAHDEVYAIVGNSVIVYREGFEVFRFVTDDRLGTLYGVAPLEDGDLLVLNAEGRMFRYSYRGRLLHEVPLSGIPGSFGAFRPDRIAYLDGRVYLADAGQAKVVVVDAAGNHQAHRDLVAVVGGKKARENFELGGFSVDHEGNLLFTVPTMFKGFIVSPSGQVRSFGSPGSIEGRFNVPGAIVRDETGTVYVADVLRCVVILFDRELRYVGDTGGRGAYPGGLIGPASMAVGNGWLFVSQGADRGVNAYRVQ